MPRTRAQRRATQVLVALDDDALRCALTFLSVSECAREPGETPRRLREMTTSKELKTARASVSYQLRPPGHGVVRALATAFGTQQWPTRVVQNYESVVSVTPPPSLQITVHRLGEMADEGRWGPPSTSYESFIASALVDPEIRQHMEGGRECSLLTGSWVQYELPFPMHVSDFRLAFGSCCCERFQDWTFEAYDSEQGAWCRLYSCDRSPWADQAYSARDARTFPVSYVGPPFPSVRFRILLVDSDIEERCVHINSLELFGTVLPGWNLD